KVSVNPSGELDQLSAIPGRIFDVSFGSYCTSVEQTLPTMMSAPFTSPIWAGSKVINASRFHAITSASRGVSARAPPADSNTTIEATAADIARAMAFSPFSETQTMHAIFTLRQRADVADA